MNQAVVANMFDRTRLAPIADGLAVAVAVSLPWSTSATSILIVLWLIAVLPTLDVASVRREGMTPAGGLPVLLWALGALGILWADASWGELLQKLPPLPPARRARHAVGRCQLGRPPPRPWLVP